jgi:hypothetical protein
MCLYADAMSRKVDMKSVSISTVALWYFCCNNVIKDLLLDTVIFNKECKSAADLAKELKKYAGTFKSQQHVYRDDMHELFELNVLMNRSFDVINWNDELKKRLIVEGPNIPKMKPERWLYLSLMMLK